MVYVKFEEDIFCFLWFVQCLYNVLAQQDILMNQRSAKILVGDNHQQIYGFRGATNAMSRVVSQHTFHLTQVCGQYLFSNFIVF